MNHDRSGVVLRQETLKNASFVSLLQIHESESFQSVAFKIHSSRNSLLNLRKRLNFEFAGLL